MAEQKKEFTIEEIKSAMERAEQTATALFTEANNRHKALKAWSPADIDSANAFLKGVEFAAAAFSGIRQTISRVNIGEESYLMLELDPKKPGEVIVEDYQRPKRFDPWKTSWEGRM